MKHVQTERSSIMGRKAVADVIKLQRRIFERQRKLIESKEVHKTSGFARYRNEYRRAVSSYHSEAGFGSLCDAVATSKVTFVSDYHTLRLAQKTLLTLLTAVQQQVDNICICTEFINAQHQVDLNKYLDGRIKEKTFLRRIKYKEQWPYDIWPNFKPLFTLAKKRGYPVIAIDHDGSLPLRKRDDLAAKIIAQTAVRYPEALIVVSAGQMHMAPSHLPAKVDLAFIRKGLRSPDAVVIYQNAEEIYWQLAQESKEEVEVVKIGPREYCINNTPPLVQQLSYLHWIQFDEEIIEYTELERTVRLLIKDLAYFLKLDAGDAPERVRVLMPGDLDLSDILENAHVDERAKRQIIRQAEAEESVCVPSLELIYLATLSVNHAAEEAAHYLKHYVSRGFEPSEIRDLFYFIVLNEACAFFGSKIINPKRKADHPGRLRTMVARAREHNKLTEEDLAARFTLEHIAQERGTSKRKRKLKSASYLADPLVFNAAAHFLGYILGDRMYYGLTEGIIARESIRQLFLAPLDKPGDALETYLNLSGQLHEVKIPKRI